MEIRDRNLLDTLLKAEFDRAKRHKQHLSCIMLRMCDLEEIDKKQNIDSPNSIIDDSVTLLSGMVRSSDIVATYNTEKFLIVLPMVNADSTTFVAQRIWRVFKDFFCSKGTTTDKPTIRMGVSSISDRDINSPGDLIRCAETALSRAMSKEGDALCLWRDLT
ncbi:MAG: GGDEF domain-containing protein [Candidatus Brocadiales bacterium]